MHLIVARTDGMVALFLLLDGSLRTFMFIQGAYYTACWQTNTLLPSFHVTGAAMLYVWKIFGHQEPYP